MELGDFLTGYRATVRRDDELLSAVLIPRARAVGRSHFQKLGARRYLVISIVMVAVRLAAERGRVIEARVALGACSPVALRLFDLENALLGQAPDRLAALVATTHLEPLRPIGDVRAPASYRRDAALALVRRSLAAASVGLR